MIDIVLPFGCGSLNDNIELHYTLRSIKKYLTGWRNLIIVGDEPKADISFDDHHVIWMPARDTAHNKEANIMRKIKVACEDQNVSKNIFVVNDDYVYLREIDVNEIPYYYDGDLPLAFKRKRKKGCYKTAIENTIQALTQKGKPLLHYDIHVPIIYEKEKFLDVMKQFDWSVNNKCGYIIKSLYCNMLEVSGEYLHDMMIGYNPTEKNQIYDDIKDRFVFAYTDSAINETGLELNKIMIEVLDELTASVQK